MGRERSAHERVEKMRVAMAKWRAEHLIAGRLQRGLALLAAAAAMAACLLAARPLAAADGSPAAFTCTNPASGARWTIGIDFAHKTVDSWPAAITSRQISWHDRKDQGFYSLDRASGELTITRASSTGGYQQHLSCRPG